MCNKSTQTLRDILTEQSGPLNDEIFKLVMHIATEDIKFNFVKFGKKPTLNTVISISVRCTDLVKRCN